MHRVTFQKRELSLATSVRKLNLTHFENSLYDIFWITLFIEFWVSRCLRLWLGSSFLLKPEQNQSSVTSSVLWRISIFFSHFTTVLSLRWTTRNVSASVYHVTIRLRLFRVLSSAKVRQCDNNRGFDSRDIDYCTWRIFPLPIYPRIYNHFLPITTPDWIVPRLTHKVEELEGKRNGETKAERWKNHPLAVKLRHFVFFSPRYCSLSSPRRHKLRPYSVPLAS